MKRKDDKDIRNMFKQGSFALCVFVLSVNAIAQDSASSPPSRSENHSSAIEYQSAANEPTQQVPFERTEERAPCADYQPLRRPLFGDTHVHTKWSFDASAQDTRNTPADAYTFARGGPIRIQPYDENGKGMREIRIDRPLDFAAVTDHAEFMGEMLMCGTEGSVGYNHAACWVHRNMPSLTQIAFGGVGLSLKRRWGYCGEDGEQCLKASESTWQMVRQDAEDAYDRSSDCSFTSFVAYEWTSTVGRGTNMHHNVIFRNEKVPTRPMSWLETPAIADLWEYFEKDCITALPGCDAVAIPHNTNLSRGLMFESPRVSSEEVPSTPITAQEAAQRAHWSPLFEVMQHKGSSECDTRQAVWAEDEFCAFEKLPYDTFGTKNTGDDGSGVLFWMKRLFGGQEMRTIQPPPATAFLRDALKRGLQEQAELGVNSFKYGMIASTDTHIAAPGLVMEKNHPGHGGAGMGSREAIAAGLPDELEFNPGGLAVLYAEENSRDALFAAIRRREAYATSGTRPVLRFFGGWDYSGDLCVAPDMVATGYARGVPMGSDLPPAPEGASAVPRFILSARADAGTADYPGTPLQRIQLIKGWYADGELQEQVLDVAGGANDAMVDINTCQISGAGHEQLCTVWEDGEFDAAAQAFYYARVLENPSCRWSQQLCADAGVRCDDAATVPVGMESCCAAEHRPTVQERAWSSPIWYIPPD